MRGKSSSGWPAWRNGILPVIGNDIVDLRLSGNRGKSGDRRFLDRVCTPEEKAFIGEFADHSDRRLWVVWAAKEAAYKALAKRDAFIDAVPVQYRTVFHRVVPIAEAATGRLLSFQGRVQTPAGEAFFQACSTVHHVHCLAVAGGDALPAGIEWCILDLPEGQDPSSWLRRAALEALARRLGVPVQRLAISRFPGPRGKGPPRVLEGSRLLDVDLSLSHDGSYGAYAFLEEPIPSAMNAC
jgi:phosphopantetheinyl transferase (holo-ACP synthase)